MKAERGSSVLTRSPIRSGVRMNSYIAPRHDGMGISRAFRPVSLSKIGERSAKISVPGFRPLNTEGFSHEGKGHNHRRRPTRSYEHKRLVPPAEPVRNAFAASSNPPELSISRSDQPIKKQIVKPEDSKFARTEDMERLEEIVARARTSYVEGLSLAPARKHIERVGRIQHTRRRVPLDVPFIIHSPTELDDERRKRERVESIREELAKAAQVTQPDAKQVQNKIVTEPRNEVSNVKTVEEKVIFDSKVNIKNEKEQGNPDKPKQVKAIVDESAQIFRLAEIKKAIEIVWKRSQKTGEIPTMREAMKLLPKDPPEPMVSGILKFGRLKRKIAKWKDGSWKVVLKILETMGVIDPKQKPESVLRAIPAVEIGQGEEVTKKDVERVIGTDDIKIAA